MRNPSADPVLGVEPAGPSRMAWRRWALAGAACLLAAIALNGPLTSTMWLHMLVHIPLIAIAGLCLGIASGGLGERAARYNAHGATGLLLFSLVGAYWMIPRALDDVLLYWPMAVAKYGSLLAAGWVLHDSMKRANMVIQLFFLGNFCWMLAVAGMLYRDNPDRLCNVYLLSDQVIAGNGLIALALGLPLVWMWAWRRRIARFLR